MAKEVTVFRLDPDLKKRLIKVAKKQNRNVSNMIETFIKDGLDRIEE